MIFFQSTKSKEKCVHTFISIIAYYIVSSNPLCVFSTVMLMSQYCFLFHFLQEIKVNWILSYILCVTLANRTGIGKWGQMYKS